MLKQIKFDCKRMFYQKKYLAIVFLVLGISILYATFLVPPEQSAGEAFDQILRQFRPIYWLVCCYVVCDLITVDYHNGVLKQVLPYSKSRVVYLLSKIVLSFALCYIILLAHLGGSFLTCIFSPVNLEIAILWKYWFLTVLGASSGIFLLIAIILFFGGMTKSEPITIGIALGLVFIQLVLESVDAIIHWIPAMHILLLSSSKGDVFNMELMVVMSLILLAVFAMLLSIQQFKRNDFFD